MMRLTVILTLVTTALAGCATEHLVITDPGGAQWPVIYDSRHATMQVTIDGKLYRGHYVNNATSSSGFITGFGPIMYGYGPFMYGYGPFMYPGFGSVQTYNPGNAGRAILFDSAGDTLDCHYNYQGTTVVGTCHDKSGDKYTITSRMKPLSHPPGVSK